jgi:hypothetical protein
MQLHPEHVDGFVEPASERFSEHADDFHHFYRIVCRCRGQRFQVFLGDKKSVRVKCITCHTWITLHDLSLYPAAVTSSGVEEFQCVNDSGGGSVVYVMYEYGERDEDETFDSNDISWCQVWIEDANGKLSRLMDDETA